MPEPVFTLANQLTMLRMALVPLFVVLLLGRQFTWALVVFAVAASRTRSTATWRDTPAKAPSSARCSTPSPTSCSRTRPTCSSPGAASRACTLPVWLTVTLLFRDVMLLVGVLVINLTLGPVDFPPSRLGKVSTALNVATGAAVLAANATGDCPDALRWLYQATLACLIATTLHYIYWRTRARREARSLAAGAAPNQRTRALTELVPDRVRSTADHRFWRQRLPIRGGLTGR
jgi:cardiolipin synthase